jgi:hypothetical protein
MPRMIELIRASAVPATLMTAASKGALSVPPQEMIEILVYLADHNKVFGDQARLTLAGWDMSLSQAAATDPNTPKEVLAYLIAPKNLRPALLPGLLQNPSVEEAALVELASTGSREVVEAMLKSPRARGSATIREALILNPNLTRAEAESLTAQAAHIEPGAGVSPEQPAIPTATEEVLAPVQDEVATVDAVLDEGLNAYLTEHAGEIAAAGDQVFQPIGGFYEDFVPGAEEPLAETPAAPATAADAGATAAPAAARKALPQKRAHLSHEEERGSALQKISKLDIKGRIQLAMKGNKEERSLLIRDGTKIVALAVLDSPKISDAEAERFASQKNVLEAVLRAIPMKRRFAKHYGIVRNLVFNPRTPLDVSLGLMKNILVHDLRNLAGNKEVSETVRKLALKMFKQKMDTSKKE